MAGARNTDLVRLEGFPKGIDNVSTESAVSRGALRAAVNVVLDDAGKPARRPGFVSVAAIDGLHSLYASERTDFMLGVADAGFLLVEPTLEHIVLGPVSRVTAPMFYDTAQHAVLCGNSLENFMVTLDGLLYPLSPPQPAGQPTVAANPLAGGLTAGQYQVAITFVDALNRESGSTLAALVDVPENGGVVLTNIPDDAAARYVNVYMSHPNGDKLYLVDSLPAPAPASRLLGRMAYGRQLDKQFLQSMPPLTHLAVSNGRLHGAVGPLHVWSETLNYGLTNPATNYVRYNDKINLIARLGDGQQAGLYVAAGARTYYVEGPDPAVWQRVVAHPHGAISGSLTYVEAGEIDPQLAGVVPVWMDTRGELIAGLAGGRVLRLHKDTYVGPENAESAAVVMASQNGMSHLVASVRGGNDASLRMSDTLDAEICRNGVVVG